jgi:anti-sigma factor RsiW
MRAILVVAALLAALAADAAADRAEDDLQLVRKAVASSPAAPARPPAEAPPEAEARPAPRKATPAWFRVRIVEKRGGKGKVSINLPLSFTRALGDDWPIAPHCGHAHKPLTIGDVLRSLDSGQSLFEVDDDDATVRIYVE